MDHDDRGGVSAANSAFYRAFEARDLSAMGEVWEHSDAVVCTHPGWPMLRGWTAVLDSWRTLFEGPQQLQFILTDEVIDVRGPMAWVTIDENLISNGASGTVAALNLFGRDDELGWRMIAHHGSSIIDRRH